MNPREYINAKYAATPGLDKYDLRAGTNIYDLVVAPLETIFADAINKEELLSLAESKSWTSLMDIPLDELVIIAQQRGIEPAIESKSSGRWKNQTY